MQVAHVTYGDKDTYNFMKGRQDLIRPENFEAGIDKSILNTEYDFAMMKVDLALSRFKLERITEAISYQPEFQNVYPFSPQTAEPEIKKALDSTKSGTSASMIDADDISSKAFSQFTINKKTAMTVGDVEDIMGVSFGTHKPDANQIIVVD